MAIILFPPGMNAGHQSVPHDVHWLSWSRRGFPNPLTRRAPMDQSLIKEIDKLYRQMLVFIEDYLTKATAICPAREYLCLPHPKGRLTFKDRPICTRLDVAQCHDTERRQFLRAFLRYELICKFCSYSGGDQRWYLRLYSLTHHLGQSEREALSCVGGYLGSLYRAMLAQCRNSDPPETNRAIFAYWAPDVFGNRNHDRTFLYPDRLCGWLACFGFDPAATLVARMTAGHHQRAIARRWFRNLAKKELTYGFYPRINGAQTVSSIIGARDVLLGEDKSYTEGPGLYRMLYPRLTSGWADYQAYNANPWFQARSCKTLYQRTLFMIYRYRAWAFFDDGRLFKSQGGWPLFPTDEAVFRDLRFYDTIGLWRDYDMLRHGKTTPLVPSRD